VKTPSTRGEFTRSKIEYLASSTRRIRRARRAHSRRILSGPRGARSALVGETPTPYGPPPPTHRFTRSCSLLFRRTRPLFAAPRPREKAWNPTNEGGLGSTVRRRAQVGAIRENPRSPKTPDRSLRVEPRRCVRGGRARFPEQPPPRQAVWCGNRLRFGDFTRSKPSKTARIPKEALFCRTGPGGT
jgi:hypothetical protein